MTVKQNIKIRKMTIDDYSSIYKLWNMTKGTGLRSIDDSAEGIGLFLNRNINTCFVAENEHKNIIGTILCGHDGRRGHIYHLTVDINSRRKGIGKALVRASEEALKEEGICKVSLVAFKTNEQGNDFWHAIGYCIRDDLFYRDKSLNDNNT